MKIKKSIYAAVIAFSFGVLQADPCGPTPGPDDPSGAEREKTAVTEVQKEPVEKSEKAASKTPEQDD